MKLTRLEIRVVCSVCLHGIQATEFPSTARPYVWFLVLVVSLSDQNHSYLYFIAGVLGIYWAQFLFVMGIAILRSISFY